MTRTVYIKPQSHTQITATEIFATAKSILEATGISKDRWFSLFFEIGCKEAERIYGEEYLHFIISPEYGYWNWWRSVWIEDDNHLLQLCGGIIPDYETLKYQMLDYEKV